MARELNRSLPHGTISPPHRGAVFTQHDTSFDGEGFEIVNNPRDPEGRMIRVAEAEAIAGEIAQDEQDRAYADDAAAKTPPVEPPPAPTEPPQAQDDPGAEQQPEAPQEGDPELPLSEEAAGDDATPEQPGEEQPGEEQAGADGAEGEAQASEPTPDSPITEAEARSMSFAALKDLSERYNGRTSSKNACIADLVAAGVVVPDAAPPAEDGAGG